MRWVNTEKLLHVKKFDFFKSEKITPWSVSIDHSKSHQRECQMHYRQQICAERKIGKVLQNLGIKLKVKNIVWTYLVHKKKKLD